MASFRHDAMPLLCDDDGLLELGKTEIEASLLEDERKPVDWRVSLIAVSYEAPRNYCMALWCPCVRFAQTAVRAKLKPKCFGPLAWALLYSSALVFLCVPLLWPWCDDDEKTTGLLKPWCGVWWLGLAAVAVVGAFKRHEIRKKYNIRHSGQCPGPVEDCCVHFLCEPFAIAQEAAHVDLEEDFDDDDDDDGDECDDDDDKLEKSDDESGGQRKKTPTRKKKKKKRTVLVPQVAVAQCKTPVDDDDRLLSFDVIHSPMRNPFMD